MNKVIEMFRANHIQLQEHKLSKKPRTIAQAKLEAYFQRVLHAHSKLFDYVEDIFSQGYADYFIMPALKKAINMKTVRKVPLYKYLHSHAHEGMCSQLLNCRAMLLDTQKLIKRCVKGRVTVSTIDTKNIPAVVALDYAKLCFNICESVLIDLVHNSVIQKIRALYQEYLIALAYDLDPIKDYSAIISQGYDVVENMKERRLKTSSIQEDCTAKSIQASNISSQAELVKLTLQVNAKLNQLFTEEELQIVKLIMQS